MRAVRYGDVLRRGMDWRRLGVTVFAVIGVLSTLACASTDRVETAALLALKKAVGDGDNHLANWQGNNPCGDQWTGVFCLAGDYPSTLVDSNVSHVTEVRILQLNLGGHLPDEIGDLVALKVFNVMWNRLTGPIPKTIGNLKNLRILLLSGNQLSGVLPLELGLLPSLHRLQIDQNRISGPIPSTFLDRNLQMIHHLHMNNNSLNGSIPPGLASLTNLAHLLLDNNQLTGTLPIELASAPSLMILQLDNNKFDRGATIPAEYGKMSALLKLSLRNCNLGGTIPDLSGIPHLAFLDLSHNLLTGPIPNTSALSSNISSIDLSFNQLTGVLPHNIGALPELQYLVLRNNNLTGTVPANLGSGGKFASVDSTTLVDLQNNGFVDLATGSELVSLQGKGKCKVWLSGNPFCSGVNTPENNPLCVPNDAGVLFDVGNLNQVFAFDLESCTPCPAPYMLAPSGLPPNKCRCAAPITVRTRLKSYCFGVFEPYEHYFVSYMSAGLHLGIEQLQIRDVTYQPGPRLAMTLLLFPPDFRFNKSEIQRLYQAWSRWEIPMDLLFGPYEFISFDVTAEDVQRSSGGLSSAAIAGIVVGVLAFVVVKTLCMFFLMRRWMRREKKTSRQPRSIKSKMRKGTHANIQVTSVRSFTFDEMAKATDHFSDAKIVGEGGYGKVYAGTLSDGQKVAIKRAEEKSHQGAKEFENEIHLLSRVHHKNLVSLIGYCNDGAEQMLVYEFIAYGSLHHHLSSKARIPLNFVTRLQIAVGSARGIYYLHTQANPPIYHRDVKTSNILLDEKLHAKVADFGISKLAPESGLEGMGGHISTVVKGTPGYLDPEYFKTHRLTDKSDVYSFGVVLLVLLTGEQPIADGKNLVREVNQSYVTGKMADVVDSRIKDSYSATALETLARLALSCCKDGPDERPSIGEVVRELEILYKEIYCEDNSDMSDTESVEDGGELKKLKKPLEYLSFPEMNTVTTSVESSALWTSSESDLHSATILDVAPR